MENIVRFYYLRDQVNRPVVTVCLIKDEEKGTISRGIAICSSKDNPMKAIGRKIAYKRAMKGLWINTDFDANISRNEALDVLNILIFSDEKYLLRFHSEKNPRLTEYETKLLK